MRAKFRFVGYNGQVKRVLLFGLTILLLITGALFALVILSDIDSGEGEVPSLENDAEVPQTTPLKTAPVAPAPPVVPSERAITLFFASADGSHLAPVESTLQVQGDSRSELEGAVAQFFKGPAGNPDLHSTWPDGIRALAVFLDARGTAYVDLTAGLPPELSSLFSESMAAYALTNTLAYSFPGVVKRVQFLIGGREAAALGSHLAIHEPLSPRRDLVGDLTAVQEDR